jgi:hypothetical protein
MFIRRTRLLGEGSATDPFPDRINVVAAPVGPEREQIEVQLCPPHAFEQGWGVAHGEEIHSDTVPVMFCGSCGEIRLMRVPE